VASYFPRTAGPFFGRCWPESPPLHFSPLTSAEALLVALFFSFPRIFERADGFGQLVFSFLIGNFSPAAAFSFPPCFSFFVGLQSSSLRPDVLPWPASLEGVVCWFCGDPWLTPWLAPSFQLLVRFLCFSEDPRLRCFSNSRPFLMKPGRPPSRFFPVDPI